MFDSVRIAPEAKWSKSAQISDCTVDEDGRVRAQIVVNRHVTQDNRDSPEMLAKWDEFKRLVEEEVQNLDTDRVPISCRSSKTGRCISVETTGVTVFFERNIGSTPRHIQGVVMTYLLGTDECYGVLLKDVTGKKNIKKFRRYLDKLLEEVWIVW